MSTPDAKWRDGFVPLVLVTAAALSWAFVPVFFYRVQGATFASALLATLLVNASKCVIALVAMVLLVGGIHLRYGQLLMVIRDRGLRRLMLLDGACIAASNLLFVMALAQGNGPIVTLILNSWPVVATVFLVRLMPRFRRISGSQVAGAAVAVLGLVVIVLASNQATVGQAPGLAVLLAFGGAIGQGVVVVLHQIFLDRVQTGWVEQPQWQALRSAVAAVLSGLVLVPVLLVAPSPLHGFEPASIGPLLVAGVFWTASSVLFHLGVARSANAFSTVPWLLAPLLSAVLVGLVQGGSLPQSAVLGGVLVLAANAMLSLTIEPPRNVSVLMITAVVVAAAVMSVGGRGVSEFYSIAQTLGTFFAISYGFLASRLHEQRKTVRLLELRWKHFDELSAADDERPGSAVVPNNERADLASFRADRDGAAHLAKSLLPISEALVVTVLGIGTCLIMIYGRPSTPVANLLAFLVASSVLFAVVLLWSSFSDKSGWAAEALPDVAPEGRTGEAVFGYLSALTAYLSIMLAILVGAADWLTL